MNRKDLAEIPMLIKENKASAFGIFCSGNLSPQAIDRVNIMKEEGYKIVFWGGKDIERELVNYLNLILKYNTSIKSTLNVMKN